MAGIFLGHTFALKYVAEVPCAVGTHDFSSFHTKRYIRVAENRAGEFIIKGRPAAAAVKFIRRLVQGCVASAANIGTSGFVVPVFATKSAFSAFLSNHIFLFRGERVPILCGSIHGSFLLPCKSKRHIPIKKLVSSFALEIKAARLPATGKLGICLGARVLDEKVAIFGQTTCHLTSFNRKSRKPAPAFWQIRHPQAITAYLFFGGNVALVVYAQHLLGSVPPPSGVGPSFQRYLSAKRRYYCHKPVPLWLFS
jgi:hypothetical protein